MVDSYTELKEVAELQGSVNAMISDIRKGKRPPSLSESWAGTADNIERAQAFLVPPVPESQELEEPRVSCVSCVSCVSPHLLLISFLFHIALISVFETLFFFFYVSTLENAGILKTVGSFTKTLLQDCQNLGPEGRQVVEWVVAPYVNATEERGAVAAQRRASVNHELVLLSWYYVIGLVAAFLVAAGTGYYRRLPIPWRRLLLENCGLVFLLGLFEGLFFTTIVYPYLPVTSQEIAASTVSQLRITCFGEPSS
jgi:hypothetical protein